MNDVYYLDGGAGRVLCSIPAFEKLFLKNQNVKRDKISIFFLLFLRKAPINNIKKTQTIGRIRKAKIFESIKNIYSFKSNAKSL